MDHADNDQDFGGVSFVLLLGVAAAQAAEQQDTKSFVYKKTKQADLELVVHYPPGWKDSDKRPAIVFFFGGGWTGGKLEQFEPQASHLARRGMVAARADYRVKIPARGDTQGMRRGRQECRAVDAGQCCQAGRRS